RAGQRGEGTDKNRWREKHRTQAALGRDVQRGPALAPLALSRFFPAAMAKTYVVTFRSHNDDRPSKFIVVADNRKHVINKAWEHGGPDFQVRFDKSIGQAQEMKEGALRVL